MTEPEQVRPEVVQAVFDALSTMDLAKLAPLAETGITPAERRQAEDLWLASQLASEDYREHQAEVWEVLIARQWSSPPSWEQLFDDLTPERAARLRDLYDALPDGARAEFDKRYGRPQD
jgi:hypothetical protein